MMLAEHALHAILKTLHHGSPDQLRKPELLSLRREVIRLAIDGLTGETPSKPRYVKTSINTERAIRLVLGYEGSNNFMLSLRLSLDSYGGLTFAQQEAVLKPPDEHDVANMAMEGIDPGSVQFHWQALDILREVRADRRRVETEKKKLVATVEAVAVALAEFAAEDA